MSKPNNPYDELNQYLLQGEQTAREKAQAWKTAIGLQEVDGLTPSDYLLKTAKRHIDGDISIDDVRDLLDAYYESQADRLDPSNETEEADKVSVNIAKLLNEQTFSFSPRGLAALHERIFDGVFKFAGTFRSCNISKREWVLRGESVLYVSFAEIKPALEYDFATEKEFSYKGLTPTEMIQHFVKFIAGIWQIHPFREGNTRTTALFAIKYLRAMGFAVNNDLFAGNSWYFRNALVRANYRNYARQIDPDFQPLEAFFRNLLLNETHELKNRYLLITPPQELTPPPETVQADRTSTVQVPNKFTVDNPHILHCITQIGTDEITMAELLKRLGLKHRQTVMENYLTPAIQTGFVRLRYPESPRHPRQKYLLTVKGLGAIQNLS